MHLRNPKDLMKADQYKGIIAFYRRVLQKADIEKVRMSTDDHPGTYEEILAHCNWMLDEMEEYLEDGRLEKVNRWLGWVQGVFFVCGIFTLDELRSHNMRQIVTPI